jgi:predicted metal-binding membrane protein
MQQPWSQHTHDARPFLVVAAGLILLAWAALFLWGMSPWARYLSHDAFDLALSGSHVWTLGLFTGGWTLMIIAMMLPTSLPLIAVFRTVVRAREDRILLISILIGGYLTVWLAFGFAAHALDLGIHQIAFAAGFLSTHPWIMGSAVFAVAGLYQFTALKYRCLDECRSPLSFVASHWGGRRPRWNALTLGAHHGIFCVGCCWSLMLLMFVVGHGNLAWMLLLGVVMGAEKNLKQGRTLAKPLGIGLLIGAVLIAGVGLLH